jgi:hypothetical protein
VDQPTAAPGLQVRCIHSPVWPQPGEPVTITVRALSGELQPKFADDIEIWVDDRTAPVLTTNGTVDATTTVGPFAGSQFSYACRVREAGLTAFTGWRTVGVGPQSGSAAPVLITGPTASRLDVVFVADRTEYDSATDPDFLRDVRDAITNAYYVRSPFDPSRGGNDPADFAILLSNQDKFNFWIANELGQAGGFDGGDCDHQAPQVSSADTRALLHNQNLRDCFDPGERIFSTIVRNNGTILHESGHALFGLADEYCCDGGYFQTETNQNIYLKTQRPPDHLRQLCAEDAPSLGRTAADCREFREDVPFWFDTDWTTSEPATDDLMADNGKPNSADLRRMNAMFTECLNAGC